MKTMSTNSNKYPAFKANLIIKGKILCKTGLHIGGSKEKLEIGGLDSPVLRDPRNRQPYIPGSSLKGKMRHLLEYLTGAIDTPVDGNLGQVSMAPEIVRIFGIGAEHKEKANKEDQHKTKANKDLENIGLSRLIVRDAFPDEYTVDDLWANLDSDLEFAEYKPENTIDRLTAAANPRFIERVVPGSRFNFEMVYSVYQMTAQDDHSRADKDLEYIMASLRMLENSALGKSGSRGYGQIKFYLEDPIWVQGKDYIEGSETYQKSANEVSENIDDLKPLDKIKPFRYTLEDEV